MKLLNEAALHMLVNELSLKFFDKPFTNKVIFNHRLRTTGGRYLLREKVIELNPLYYLEASEAAFIGIIKHELCHYHLHIEGRGYKHSDADFKALLLKTDAPRFCNPLELKKTPFKYTYLCSECKYIYKRARRINLLKYRCGKCNGKLLLDEGKR